MSNNNKIVVKILCLLTRTSHVLNHYTLIMFRLKKNYVKKSYNKSNSVGSRVVFRGLNRKFWEWKIFILRHPQYPDKWHWVTHKTLIDIITCEFPPTSACDTSRSEKKAMRRASLSLGKGRKKISTTRFSHPKVSENVII